MTLTGTGYTANAGQPIVYALIDETGGVLRQDRDSVPVDGVLDHTFVDLAAAGGGLQLAWFIDTGNDGCDTFDPQWVEAIAPVDQDVTVVHDYARDFAAMCDLLD